MINDIIEELLDLDLEPKPESLWWMSTYKEEDKSTLKMGYAVRPGVGSSGRFRRTGKGGSGDGKDTEKWNGMLVAGWVHIYRAKSVKQIQINDRGAQFGIGFRKLIPQAYILEL